MISRKDLRQLSEYCWEIPRETREDMLTPARVYGSWRIIESAMGDESLDQLANTATLPGMANYTMAMPDIHQGYGFPIGGVAAAYADEGMISPGGVGYDIACGVRLMASTIPGEEAAPNIETLAAALSRGIPKGTGEGSSLILTDDDLEGVLADGSQWLLGRGYATEMDVRRTEAGGRLAGAEPAAISRRAWERGRAQLGSLGSGNHFIEIDVVEEIFAPEAAAAMGLSKGMIAIQIHTGSRGLGHQVCTDTLREFQSVAERKYRVKPVDRQLMCVPIRSAEGEAYFGAMNAAGNFAFANRQMIATRIREIFAAYTGSSGKAADLTLVADIAHNLARLEKHEVDGKKRDLLVHRKGATRAFGPGSPDLPTEYRECGQPVLVPGSMGTASWVLAGTETGMRETFGSCCHGAGRMMSRTAARKAIRGDRLRADLEARGIRVKAGSMGELAEEAPEAYKDVDEVVRSVTGAGIARKVARLIPLAVIKG